MNKLTFLPTNTLLHCQYFTAGLVGYRDEVDQLETGAESQQTRSQLYYDVISCHKRITGQAAVYGFT